MYGFGDFTMNINKLTGGVDNNTRLRKDPGVSPTDTPESASSATGNTASSTSSDNYSDRVKLSASSKSMQQVEAEISAMPEVNDATVDRIRNAINNGDYKIDYDKLAGKMLDFEGRLN
jgi:negative regulator of flagellin synthesis FlgM